MVLAAPELLSDSHLQDQGRNSDETALSMLWSSAMLDFVAIAHVEAALSLVTSWIL